MEDQGSDGGQPMTESSRCECDEYIVIDFVGKWLKIQGSASGIREFMRSMQGLRFTMDGVTRYVRPARKRERRGG